MEDRWAFVAMTDQELLAKLSAEEDATTDGLSTMEEAMTDDELLDEIEMEEPWLEEERTEIEDMARGHISIRRSWSNTELYRLVLTVQPGEGAISRKIEAITVEQREDHPISSEQAKMGVVLLCRSHLDCDLAAAPDDEISQFSGLL